MAVIGIVAGRAKPAAGSGQEGRFFVWLAAAMAITAFAGFAPTYWLQIPAGTVRGPGLLHLHAVLFSAWTLLMVWQAWLAAKGQVRRHRAFGLAGVSLASMMALVGLAMAIARVRHAEAAGYGPQAHEFMGDRAGQRHCPVRRVGSGGDHRSRGGRIGTRR